MIEGIESNEAVFPISVVREITGLTARQIRYYEEHNLVKPTRNDVNRRMYCLNDIKRFMEIKALIDDGVNIAGIKAVYQSNKEKAESRNIKLDSDKELKQLLLRVKEKLSDFK